MRAEAVAKVTRLYPFLSGCGTLANHRVTQSLAGHPTHDAWAKVEGGRLSVSLSDYVGRSAFYVGDLDRKVSSIINRFVHRGDTVLDIGANIGLVSLQLAKRVGPSGTVHAFEPNPKMVDRLKRSLHRNSLDNVEVYPAALGARHDTLTLSVPSGNAGAASFLRTGGETLQVPVHCLDDYDFGPVSFVKMDVEGFEEQVLWGFSRTLKATPPKVILFEQNDNRGGSIPLLMDAGYRVHGVAKSLLRLKLEPVSAWQREYHDYVATRR